MKGRLLDVGCGRMPYRQEILETSSVTAYWGMDIEGAFLYDESLHPDLTWDGVSMPIPDESFDCVLATEVFEHVPDIDCLLREIKRVLKPEGVIYFTTPFLWPYHEVPHDCQRWTSFGLQQRLKSAGFREIKTESRGNWHSSLAQFIGLWVARAPMNGSLRRLLKFPVFWIQKVLMKNDSESIDEENSMPRMIVGTAKR